MDKKNVLSIKNLNKIYSKKSDKPIHAINNLNLDVQEGEIFGLLGPNGAGKTTFINILAGTVIKTSGKVNVWGFDLDNNPRQVRASIGIVPQEVNLDPFFTPRKLLELQAGLYGVKKKDRITDAILKLVSLEDHANSYARSLSGGMKRRLLIAKSLFHQPPIIILDEPTAGVDVEIRQSMWLYLKQLNKEGVTIILTTHYLEEAERLCKNLAIIHKGKIVQYSSMDKIFEMRKTHTYILKTLEPAREEAVINNFRLIKVDKYTYEATISDGISVTDIIEKLKSININVVSITNKRNILEELFLEITKEKTSL